MKKVLGLFLGTLAVVAFAMPSAYAEGCRNDQYLRQIGAATGTGWISTSSAEVRLIQLTCTSTACVAGLYDIAEGSGGTASVNAKLEPGAAASTTALLPQSGFFEQPVTFNNGIWFVDNGNVAYIALFECAQR